MASTSMLVDVKGAGEAAKGMAARSRGVVRMMTRKSELEESGVWQTLEKKKGPEPGKLKKKKLTHIYSHSHRAVHTSRHDGEKAGSLTSSRTRWRRREESSEPKFLSNIQMVQRKFR